MTNINRLTRTDTIADGDILPIWQAGSKDARGVPWRVLRLAFSGGTTGASNFGDLSGDPLENYALAQLLNYKVDSTALSQALQGKQDRFAGSATQYIKGDGTLGTFPSNTLPTSVSWSAIQGAVGDSAALSNVLFGKQDKFQGTQQQYVRGDGTLATFPQITNNNGGTTTGEPVASASQMTVPSGAGESGVPVPLLRYLKRSPSSIDYSEQRYDEDGNSYGNNVNTVQDWPLSKDFGTLEAAQAVFPFVTSLDDQRDWAELQAAIYSGNTNLLPSDGEGRWLNINRAVYCGSDFTRFINKRCRIYTGQMDKQAINDGDAPGADLSYPDVANDELGPVTGAAFVFTDTAIEPVFDGLEFDGARFPIVFLAGAINPIFRNIRAHRSNCIAFCYSGDMVNPTFENCGGDDLGTLLISSATAYPSDHPETGSASNATSGLTVIGRDFTPKVYADFNTWFSSSIFRPAASSVGSSGTSTYTGTDTNATGRKVYIPKRNAQTQALNFVAVSGGSVITNSLVQLGANAVIDWGTVSGTPAPAPPAPSPSPSPSPAPSDGGVTNGAVVEGDSIEQGGGTNSQSWPSQFSTLTNIPVRNIAVQGDTLSSMLNNFDNAGGIGAAYSSGYRTLIIGGGTNDLALDNQTTNRIKELLYGLCHKATIDKGYTKVYIMTILPRTLGVGGWDQAREDRRLEVNASIRSDYATFGATGFIDRVVGFTTADTFDGIHPTNSGALKIAQSVKSVVVPSATPASTTFAYLDYTDFVQDQRQDTAQNKAPNGAIYHNWGNGQVTGGKGNQYGPYVGAIGCFADSVSGARIGIVSDVMYTITGALTLENHARIGVESNTGTGTVLSFGDTGLDTSDTFIRVFANDPGSTGKRTFTCTFKALGITEIITTPALSPIVQNNETCYHVVIQRETNGKFTIRMQGNLIATTDATFAGTIQGYFCPWGIYRQTDQGVDSVFRATVGFGRGAREALYSGTTYTVPTTPPALGAVSTSFTPKGVVFDGDSIPAGVQQNTNPYPAQWASLTGIPIFNLAVSGDKIGAVNARFASGAQTKFNAQTCDTYMLHAGTNDLGGDGLGASNLLSSIKQLVAQARAVGFKVVVSSIMDRGLPSDVEALRLSINQEMRNTWPQWADGFVDFATAVTGQSGFFDGLHPTNATSAVMASEVRKTITN